MKALIEEIHGLVDELFRELLELDCEFATEEQIENAENDDKFLYTLPKVVVTNDYGDSTEYAIVFYNKGAMRGVALHDVSECKVFHLNELSIDEVLNLAEGIEDADYN